MKFRNHSSRSVVAHRISSWSRCLLVFATICISSALTSGLSHAAPFSWKAVATDGFWGESTNWDTGTVPNASTTDITFTDSNFTTLTINDPGPVTKDRSAGTITFSGTTDSFIINSGGVLNMYGAAGITVDAGTPGQVFGVQVRPRTSMTITNNGTGLLNFSGGGIMTTSSSATPLTITFDGTGDISTRRFVKRLDPGLTNLVKNGAGKLTIVDSFPVQPDSGAVIGTTTINAGTVSIDDELNLGGGPVAFDSTGLLLNGGALQATATFSIDDANRGVSLGASNGTIDVTAANTLSIANDVTGAGSLTKTGVGTLNLQGDNSYSGGTIVDEGTLTLDGTLQSADIQVNGNATMDGSGEVIFDNSEVIVLALDGTLNAENLLFNLNALTLNDDGKVLVDYSAGGIFNGPTNLEDMLATTLVGAWTLIDTGSTVIAEFTVPEPSTLWLLSLGLVAGNIRRRRQRNG